MGGVRIDAGCRTAIPGLLVAGEDAGGVHGANRLGGNGVAESTVFGAVAGETAAALCRERAEPPPFDPAAARAGADRAARFLRPGSSPFALRSRLDDLMWERGGLVREGEGLALALRQLEAMAAELESVGVPGGRSLNFGWQAALDVENLLTVARLVVEAAAHRTESRGSHYRSDFPLRDDKGWLQHTVTCGDGSVRTEPVVLTRLHPVAGQLSSPPSSGEPADSVDTPE
jgi:succinate dehydrogenase / fumarate reductase flavoprotein subunit/fumarate reductase flavoprotein subunit